MMDQYELSFSTDFERSLKQTIASWESIGIDADKIRSFVSDINAAVASLKQLPNRFAYVHGKYHIPIPTRQIMIGDHYAILYRVKKTIQIVEIGPIFNLKQMNLTF
ncbi:plasmid stabilization protein [Lentilactobacillus parakefiri]|uniref:Plasmid stabilization system protein n=1 Tax=Lentilactobacillus parakefiri TaxID=152332 RepID=A0A224V4B4_9LACO|nr:plasmid stabilization protein [Lentilactobacillus parakefiri]KRL61144.1 hypothetical protein FD08_GL002978 [Lentilactobacillus parakefiri DSM 10551]TDG92803.1 hypothetical protein C5L28_001668 [Lentilactobacillus parakefiri]GAW71797.1 plasmid stabilization system protein [Lentilactobacillus parakefiri]